MTKNEPIKLTADEKEEVMDKLFTNFLDNLGLEYTIEEGEENVPNS